MRGRAAAILLLIVSATLASHAQPLSPGKELKSQLQCKTNPQAGKLLTELRRNGFIGRTYVVEDTISYFKLLKPVTVWSFKPVAVFGFQEGFENFFERGPGTLPPEMIGIVVRGNQSDIKLRMRNLGITNLEIEPHDYDINSGKSRKSNLVSIACWAV